MRVSAPTRRLRAAVATLGVTLLAVTACSSSTAGPKAAVSAKPSASGSAPASATATPSATASPTATPTAVVDFPTVTGAYGVKPTISFPFANPSAQLQAKVLSEGTRARGGQKHALGG